MPEHPWDISIVVPVYNIPENYLRCCVDSLLSQTLRSIQVILVDDGSQNGCGSICDRYAREDARVLAVHQKNQGVSAARNAGMRLASGKYLMFVDPDDWLEADCCEKALAAIDRTDYKVIMFDCRVVNEISGKTSAPAVLLSCELTGEDLTQFQLDMLADQSSSLRGAEQVNIRSPWGMLLDRGSCLKQNLSFVEGLHKEQDTIFNLYLYECAGLIFHLGYIGYNYRLHRSSVTYRYDPNMAGTIGKVVHEEERFVERYHHGAPEYYRALWIGAFHKLHNVERTYLFHRDSALSLGECAEEYKRYLCAVGLNGFLDGCSVWDFPTLRLKVRFLMRKGVLLWFYLFLKRIKYRLTDIREKESA